MIDDCFEVFPGSPSSLNKSPSKLRVTTLGSKLKIKTHFKQLHLAVLLVLNRFKVEAV